MRIFDIGAKEGPEVVSERILTVPNVLSFLRLLVLPVVYVMLVRAEWMTAFVLLAIFASTDWLDGYIARKFDQVTKLGKLLDPISDRFLVVVVGVGMIVSELVPWWVIVALIVRDLFVMSGGLYLISQRLTPPPVTRVGKAATFGLMWALPSFILAAALGDGPSDPQPIWQGFAWFAWATNTVLYYIAAGQYVVAARAQLAERASSAT